ncbi:MAG: aspartyl/asparaginyl beta-hydroxylase domain-containing protein [Microthrixaceae bacterium]
MSLIKTISGKSAERPSDYEEPYYWATGAGFYGGKYPAWWDVSQSEVAKLLEDNYEEIKAEVLDFYENRRAKLRPNWLQWGYSNEGWLTLDLYSFGMKTHRNCKEFPFLHSLVSEIPGMMLAQVAVLKPNTRIRPHIGETSGLIRCHLPLVVPGTAPDLGMRVGSETRCWEEGKVFALNIAYRHAAWNLTDKPRLIVVVDYVHPDFADRQHEIEANSLALMGMKGFANWATPFKKAPTWVTKPIQSVLAVGFRAMLFLQRRFDIAPSKLVAHRPPGRRRSIKERLSA